MRAARYFAVCLLLLGGNAAGCREGNDASKQRETSHIRSLTSLYGVVASRLGHLPKNEQEFKQAIMSLNPSLENMRVQSVDELFTSERDGQPLVVVYGASLKNSDVVVYEQTGVEGKRQVGHRIGMVEEVDEAQYTVLTGMPKK